MVFGHAPGVILSAFGTAAVDGAISEGEYGSCVGPVKSGPYTFTICETNDRANNYFAIRINDQSNELGTTGDQVWLLFDNMNDGKLADCSKSTPSEDSLWLRSDGEFTDTYLCSPRPGSLNMGTGEGGSTSGSGKVSFEKGVGYVYEFWHPLSSGDAADYNLSFGNVVGFCFGYSDARTTAAGLDVEFPASCNFRGLRGDMSQFGDIKVASPPSTPTPANDGIALLVPLMIKFFESATRADHFLAAENV